VAGPLVWNSLSAVSRDFLQAPKDVSVCTVLIFVRRIRGFTTMRYINLRFTYLPTDLLTYSHSGPIAVPGSLKWSVKLCIDKISLLSGIVLHMCVADCVYVV